MATPERIGPYVIIGEIGRGGMGVVYLALDPDLERQVAIKTLPEHAARNPSWLYQLVREARALGRLSHPNIAQIFSMEIQENRRYLVLEYVPGENLAGRLRRGRPRVDEALGVCLQIACGLEAAHNRGVLHRDLKPENVRITPDGIVKIIDFGLALIRPVERIPEAAGETVVPGAAPGISGLTTSPAESEWMVGTPGYMSPEQVRGRPIDRRSDIFSFGCVCYECLTGEPAFHGGTRKEVLTAVLLEEPQWLKLPRDTPPPIARMLPRCLEKDLGRRLCDIGDARLEIEALLHERRAGSPAPAGLPLEVPGNLPLEMTSFVGRDSILDGLASTLASNRFLTLTGAGGCGKTRLALRLGRGTPDRYADGAWLVELAGMTDPALVPGTVARTMNLHEAANPPSIEGLVGAMRRKSLLLILDNCEHLLGACRPLADRLLRGCPGVRVLATSREALGLPGEFVFVVPSLTLPGLEEPPDPEVLTQYESVRLFLERARMARPSFALTRGNSLAVARICRRLDGIPLAIELAASRMKILTVEQIEAKLDDRFRLLTGGSAAGVERHRTLRATVDWSYELLSEDEKRIFRGLSVFAGSWTLDAAAAVCGPGLDDFQLLDLLTRLVEKSLILVDEGSAADVPQCARYRMHETMRHYARKLLGPKEEITLRDRHHDYYLAFAERTGPGSGTLDAATWGRLMTMENDNLLEALRWSLATDDGTSRDLRLARVMRRPPSPPAE